MPENILHEPHEIGRVASFLASHPLEELVANVKKNNIRESESRLAELEAELIKTYQACSEVVLQGKGVYGVAREHDFPIARLRNYKYKDTLPRILANHRKNLTPTTAKERISFAYLLGVHSKTSAKSKKGKCLFGSSIFDRTARKRAIRTGRIILGEELREEGEKLRFPDSRLVRLLNHCLEHAFSEYVKTDKERVAYLQGFFDASNATIREGYPSGKYYKISRSSNLLFHIFAKTLFELGVFPRLDRNDRVMYIEGRQNLSTFHELEIDRDKANRAAVASLLLKPNYGGYGLRTYYETRAMVRKKLEEGGINNWNGFVRRIRSFGVAGPSVDTVKMWTADIVKEFEPEFPYQKNVPFLVQRYERLLEYLELPNVFREEAAVKAREIRLFEERYPYQDTLQVRVNGEIVTFTNNALLDFFEVYGLNVKPLTEEDIECLREQYSLRQSLEGDLKFEQNEQGEIMRISFKGATGSNRWGMGKSYTGLSLGGDSSDIRYVFGVV